jgi:CheY-like chemotaxis protein
MEAIGQLAGGVAHDFNNILTAIIGYGSILHRKMEKNDPLRINVEHMLASADRAAHLTYSLLAFSRKQILDPRHVDLNDIIARVENLLRRVIGEDIELKTSLKKGPVTVNADSGQIEQVLMNLATNARDAMPRGGSFTIETDTLYLDEAFARVHGYGEAGAYALVSVTDTGTGMDEEMRKKIFEPFFTTKEVGRGTGLGLSIVYGIIKQHQGFINVYSEPGKGTAFKIYLPLLKPEIEKKMPAAVYEEEPPRGTETVLVAEDDDAVRELSRAVLEESGYMVIEAKDGADAVDKFMKNRDAVRLVILDMIMPKKSGKEAYEEIKKTNPAIKTIFVSGYTADKLQREGLLEQGMELIIKPLGPGAFLKKVREVLDK